MTETTSPKWVTWVSYGLSGLAGLMLTFSSVMKLSQSAQVVEGFAKSGYPPGTLVPIGIAELACVVLYAVPKTSILGAILATGYLGGAVATHVRQGDSFVAPLLVGVVVWFALWLRDPAIKRLIPLRQG